VIAVAIDGNQATGRAAAAKTENAPLNRNEISRYRETLQRLATLLADDDVQALSLWHESAVDLRAAFNGRATPFEAALIAYDFAAAHALLADTLAELAYFENTD
jgi:hypothetical protein